MDSELNKNLKALIKVSILVLVLVAFYLLFTYVLPIIGKALSYIPVLFLPFIIAIIIYLYPPDSKSDILDLFIKTE